MAGEGESRFGFNFLARFSAATARLCLLCLLGSVIFKVLHQMPQGVRVLRLRLGIE